MRTFVVTITDYNGKSRLLKVQANSETDAFDKAIEQVGDNYHSISVPITD